MVEYWGLIIIRQNMNRIFGFFKEKLIEAKEQNQAEIQNILNAIEFQAYSQARMLNYLQEIKTNYLQWNIMIANEASTGLYYTQVHNRTALVRKVKNRKEGEEKQERNGIVLGQMRKTLKELKEIEKLNGQWVNNMNERVGQLGEMLRKSKLQKEMKKEQEKVQEEGQKDQDPTVVSVQKAQESSKQPQAKESQKESVQTKQQNEETIPQAGIL